jgi:hypothetical protein
MSSGDIQFKVKKGIHHVPGAKTLSVFTESGYYLEPFKEVVRKKCDYTVVFPSSKRYSTPGKAIIRSCSGDSLYSPYP